MRGPGRAEVQEEGRALSRDPGWRRLILLWTRSWRWGLGFLWEEGRRGPKRHRQEALPLVLLSFGQRGGDGLEFFCVEDVTLGALLGSHIREIAEGGDRALLLRVWAVEDDRRGNGACPWDLLGGDEGKVSPSLGTL